MGVALLQLLCQLHTCAAIAANIAVQLSAVISQLRPHTVPVLLVACSP